MQIPRNSVFLHQEANISHCLRLVMGQATYGDGASRRPFCKVARAERTRR